MAKAASETKKTNLPERGLRFLRNVHIALGTAALVGSVVFPPLEVFAAYEGVNALAHEGLRQIVKPKSKSKKQHK
ncbi:MAG TPA: hypothetical protein VLH84_03185 [Patescibacteria group bacterium]|nr:hypothetical protein [Patescibacteria group bacterium]